MKWKANAGRAEDFFFVRDSNGVEADLALDAGRELHLFEIKAARTPDASLAKNLRSLAKSFPVKTATVLCRAAPFPIPGGGRFVPFERLCARLAEIAGEP